MSNSSAPQRLLFGTDGIRGPANRAPLLPDFVVRLGQAAAVHFAGRSGVPRPLFVIGRDTRVSGPLLESALAAGLSAAGADVLLAGVVPTPAVAFLARSLGAQAGVVVSASHNPYDDNGIKFFQGDGFKLDDADEAAIEGLLASPENLPLVAGAGIGRIDPLLDAAERYVNFVASGFEAEMGRSEPLAGLSVALDMANGAAWRTTPDILRRLGAEIFLFDAAPDGMNINAGCGSTHAEEISRRTRETGARVGLAHDGDADRLLLCDETGDALDGDELLALCGLDLLERDLLPHRTLVATVMSNAGLEAALRAAGGRLVRTGVGDRYVLEEMRRGGYVLGGEQSGHLIFLNHHTTGDGIVAALQVLRLVALSGQPLSALRRRMSKFPQLQRDLRVPTKPPLETLPGVRAALAEVEAELGPVGGRALLRYSGTEPKIRLLLEGPDAEPLPGLAERVMEAVRRELGVGN